MSPDEGEAGRHEPVPALSAKLGGQSLRRADPRAAQVFTMPVEDDEDEGEGALNLLHYWHILLKWRWVVAGCAVLGLAAGFLATLLTTPIYRASTTLQIDHEPAKIVAVESAQAPDSYGSEEFYQTQYGLLKSRSLAERVVANLNLAYDEDFMDQAGSMTKDGDAGAAAAAAPRTAAERKARAERAAGIVMSGLTVEPVQRSRLVKVSYDSPNPQIAAKIANAVADNFISQNLERRYEASSYARKFLEGRLNQIRERLEESERQLVAYAASNQLVTVAPDTTLTGEGAESAAPARSLAETDLASINSALAQAISVRIQAEQRWRQAQLTPDMSLPEVQASSTVMNLQGQRATLAAEYQQNLRTYKPDYPTMVDLKARIDAIDRQIAAQAQAIKGALRNQYEVALRQEQSLAGAVQQSKGEVLDQRSRSIQYNIIQREVDTNRSLYDGLLQRYKEIGVAGGIGTNNVAVVDRATVPGGAIKPQPLKNLVTFCAAGLLAGALLAFLLEQFDLSIKTPDEIEKVLGLPLLGAIPVATRDVSSYRAIGDPKSVLSEAYYSVRTSLKFSTPNGVPHVLLITSAGPGEGKTTSALAVATTFARIGMRVLLIDGDLRDPSLHKILARDNGVGLSNLLAGGPELTPALQPTDQPNLTFLACGPLPPNPSELLGSEKMRNFLDAARDHFDLVVIDGPPVLGLADAPLLSSMVNGTAFVVEAGRTKREVAKGAIKRLRLVESHLVGVVLTKFDMKKAGYRYGHAYGYGYGYGYGFDYGASPQPGASRLRLSRAARMFGRGR
ncbi:MAG: GumC family protein [Phenylobacterium sp.]|uniref:GumC family protein n=1 Tax=Phenylobacterium sp. TaxID=1871053 RepID=UPI0039187533